MTPETARDSVRVLAAFAITLFFVYSSTYVHPYLLSDDYAVFAGVHDPESNVVSSGRPLYYVLLMAGRRFFGLDSDRLLALHAIALLGQVIFAGTLYHLVRLRRFGPGDAFLLSLFVMTLPGFQILFGWLVGAPCFLAGAAALWAVMLFHEWRPASPGANAVRVVGTVALLAASFLVYQAIVFVAAAALVLHATTATPEEWRRSRRRHVEFVLLLVFAGALSLGVAWVVWRAMGLGPASRIRDVGALAGGGVVAALVEKIRNPANLMALEFSTIEWLRDAAWIWLVTVVGGIGLELRRVWNTGARSDLAACLQKEAFALAMLGICLVPRLVNPIVVYRVVLPVTLGALFLSLKGFVELARWLRERSAWERWDGLFATVKVVVVLVAAVSATIGTSRNIVMPAVAELVFVKQELLRQGAGDGGDVFVIRPEGKWHTFCRRRPCRDIFGLWMSSRHAWVPVGMVRFALSDLGFDPSVSIRTGTSADEAEGARIIIDMNALKRAL
jgi:hypothetical protein